MQIEAGRVEAGSGRQWVVLATAILVLAVCDAGCVYAQALDPHISTDRGCIEGGQSPVYVIGESVQVTYSINSTVVGQAQATVFDVLADSTVDLVLQRAVFTNQALSFTGTINPPIGQEQLQLRATASGFDSQVARCSFMVAAVATATVTTTRTATVTRTATSTASAVATSTSSHTSTASPTESATRTPTPTSTVPIACIGDCNRNGVVTIDEVLTMANIALEKALLSLCAAGDGNRDHKITVDEILAAVNAALTSCPGRATPSATSTPTGPTATPTRSPTATPTMPTATASRTATRTPTTSTATPTRTATTTSTAATGTPTRTATRTPTGTPTSTATRTPTFTATSTPTITPTATRTPTATPTNTATNSPTVTPTNTLSATPTRTRTPTRSGTPKPTPTDTPTTEATATNTTTPTRSSTPSRTPTPTATPTRGLPVYFAADAVHDAGELTVVVRISPPGVDVTVTIQVATGDDAEAIAQKWAARLRALRPDCTVTVQPASNAPGVFCVLIECPGAAIDATPQTVPSDTGVAVRSLPSPTPTVTATPSRTPTRTPTATAVMSPSSTPTPTEPQGLPGFHECTDPTPVFDGGSAPYGGTHNLRVGLAADTGANPSGIVSRWSADFGATFGPIVNVTNDSNQNFNPSVGITSGDYLWVSWVAFTPTFSAATVRAAREAPGDSSFSGPLDVHAGTAGALAIQPTTNRVFVAVGQPGGGIGLSTAAGESNTPQFSPVSPVSPAGSNPSVSFGGEMRVAITWNDLDSNFKRQRVGRFSTDGGVTWGLPETLHTAASTADVPSFGIGSLGFLSNGTYVSIGANGGPSGNFIWADFGTIGGPVQHQMLATGITRGNGYIRSDDSLVIGAVGADGSFHLLQGKLGQPFSDLPFAKHGAVEVFANGNDTTAIVAETLNSVPGPITVRTCR